MLVLGRKAGEQILIGDDIVVTVLEIDERQIKVGIDAPRQVRILRSELLDKAANDVDPDTRGNR